MRADETIRKIAQHKMDSVILAICSRDCAAAEAHYHKSCYINYTRQRIEKQVADNCEDDTDMYLKTGEKHFSFYLMISETKYLHHPV